LFDFNRCSASTYTDVVFESATLNFNSIQSSRNLMRFMQLSQVVAQKFRSPLTLQMSLVSLLEFLRKSCKVLIELVVKSCKQKLYS
jgi:hypothetical protein